MAPPNWPQVIVEGGFVTTTPVQASPVLILDDAVNGKLNTGVLGGDVTWSDITAWTRSARITRPADRQQGPIYDFGIGTANVVLNNKDGRFDPANLSGPYAAAGVTELNPMVPLRIRAVWGGITYPLYWGFVDSWDDDGVNYAGNYAETTAACSDAQKVLAGNQVREDGATAGAGELTGARINRILDAVPWYTGTLYRVVGAGSSTVQAFGGQSSGTSDSAWNLLKLTADSEIGELYVNGAGAVVFRGRQQILTDTRSNTPQLVLGDSIGTAETAGTEQAFFQAPRARDDTTLANDIHAMRAGGSLQEVQDAASQAKYLFPRTFERTDLILQDDPTVINWAQWVLYIAKDGEDRFDTIILKPLRDPVNLWSQVLGREIGDRIQIWRRPPGVAAFSKDLFIRGIEHSFDVASGDWTTIWTMQDADKYGGFLTLDNPTLGRLNFNALAF